MYRFVSIRYDNPLQQLRGSTERISSVNEKKEKEMEIEDYFRVPRFPHFGQTSA